MKTSKLFDRVVPKEFTIASEVYTVEASLSTDSQTFTFADSTPTTIVVASCAGSNGMLPTKGVRLMAILEGVVACALTESATAEAYTTDLAEDTALVSELASNLYDALDSMKFESATD